MDQCISTFNENGYLWEVILPTDTLSKRGDFRGEVQITYYVYAMTRQDAIQIAKSWLPVWDTGDPKYVVREGAIIKATRYTPDVQLVRKEHRLRMEAISGRYPRDESIEDYEELSIREQIFPREFMESVET